MTTPNRDHALTAVLLAAQAALTSDERAQFLARFPDQQGAHVADILAALDQTDSDVDVIEAYQRKYGNDVPEPHLLNAATYLCLYMVEVNGLTWKKIAAMVERIRPLIPTVRNDVTGLLDDDHRTFLAQQEIERRLAERDAEAKKAAVLAALAPLGFVDAEDGEEPDYIFHPAIGSFDSRKVNLANVIELAFNAGRLSGQDELQAKFRQLIGVAPG